MIGGISMVCCFFGHRKIVRTPELIHILSQITEDLIVKEKVNIFLFGCNSEFDDLCYELVTELMSKYPYIKRIYVRAKFPYISDEYKYHLSEQFEDTYYPEKVFNSGRAAYVMRNQDMIDNSDFCVFYYDENYLPPKRKKSSSDAVMYQPRSGTEIAFKYAVKNKKRIINIVKKEATDF